MSYFLMHKVKKKNKKLLAIKIKSCNFAPYFFQMEIIMSPTALRYATSTVIKDRRKVRIAGFLVI